jgi:hypothetical protein
MLTYRGNATTTPFGGDAIASSSGTAHTTPSVTPSEDDCLVLGMIFTDPNGNTEPFTVSTGTSRAELYEASQGSLCVSELIQTSAAPQTFSLSTALSTTWGDYTCWFKAAAGGGGGTTSSYGYIF